MLKVRSPAERLNRQKGATEPRRTQASSRSSHDAHASRYVLTLQASKHPKASSSHNPVFFFHSSEQKPKRQGGATRPKVQSIVFKIKKTSLSVRFLRTTNSVLASRSAATAKQQLKARQQSQVNARRSDKTDHRHKLATAAVLFQSLKADHTVCKWSNRSWRVRKQQSTQC